jgi:hypothetical protein
MFCCQVQYEIGLSPKGLVEEEMESGMKNIRSGLLHNVPVRTRTGTLEWGTFHAVFSTSLILEF